MRSRSRRLLLIFIFLIITGGVVVAIVPPALNSYARNKIQDAVAEACPHCELKIGSLFIDLLTGTVTLENIRFADAPEHPTTLDFHLRNIQAEINVWSLRRPVTEITRLRIEGLELTATDDAKKVAPVGAAFPKGEDDGLAQLPPLQIDRLELTGCAFTYANRGVDRRRAHLSVYDINGHLQPILTRPAGDSPIRSHISARFEQSGAVLIDLEIHPFMVDHHDKISIQVDHQNLKDLDPMFFVEDGIALNGIVDQVRADLTVHNARVTGQVFMKYHDLKLDLVPTEKRSVTKNILAQVIQKIILIPARPRNDKDQPVAQVDVAREPNQSIFQFLLSGIKPALAKLVTNL